MLFGAFCVAYCVLSVVCYMLRVVGGSERKARTLIMLHESFNDCVFACVMCWRNLVFREVCRNGGKLVPKSINVAPQMWHKSMKIAPSISLSTLGHRSCHGRSQKRFLACWISVPHAL